MRRWKYFELSNEGEVLQEINSWILTRPDVLTSPVTWHYFSAAQLYSWLPKMCAAIETKGVKATGGAAIVKQNSDEATPIHNDNTPNTSARLLFPVINTEGSSTVFYECSQPPKTRIKKNESRVMYYEFDTATCHEIDRVATSRPVVICVDRPHKIELGSAKMPRITLTVSLDKDPIRWLAE